MLPDNFNLWEELTKALGETAVMVVWALLISVVLGGVLGLLLFLTSSRLFVRNQIVNQAAGTIVNIIRSIPFIILLVLLLPLSKAIVQTTIGPKAVIVPLAVAAIAFFARIAEASFSDVRAGVLEAAISSGASHRQVIFGILLPEALPSLIKGVTLTAISLIGYSAMAGTVGGGGIGNLAIRYGYQRYNTTVMIVCVVALVIIVQVLQLLGDFIAKKTDKK